MNKELRPFAKWIPVDGEITDGDYWIYKGYAMSPVQQKEDPFPQDTGHKVRQKVKLFLFSRDVSNIKVDFDQQQWQEMDRSEKDDYLVKTNQYKVLGEISQKALTYVREGQEFNEDKYQLSKHPECPKCGAWDNDGFCPEDVDCQIANKRTVAYIQCSNCKIFH
jgi:hypothetical protein